MGRREGDFSRTVRSEALKRAGHRCEICEKKTAVYYHHILPLGEAKKFPDVPLELLKSLDNVLVTCETCHKNIHETEKNYREIADALLRSRRAAV